MNGYSLLTRDADAWVSITATFKNSNRIIKNNELIKAQNLSFSHCGGV